MESHKDLILSIYLSDAPKLTESSRESQSETVDLKKDSTILIMAT